MGNCDRQLRCCYGAAGSQTLTEPELTTSLPAATRLLLSGVVIDASSVLLDFFLKSFGFPPELTTLGRDSSSFDAAGVVIGDTGKGNYSGASI